MIRQPQKYVLIRFFFPFNKPDLILEQNFASERKLFTVATEDFLPAHADKERIWFFFLKRGE